MGDELLMKLEKNNFWGFSLAEVLVTLGILGVVAAFTIPTLLNSYQDSQYKTAYKKAFSISNQAIQNLNNDYLLSPVTGEGDLTNKSNFLAFMGQFQVVKSCTSNNGTECWNTNGEKYNTSYPNQNSPSFIDNSGVAWSMYWNGASNILVDTNGNLKPNKWGKDRFELIGTNNKKQDTNSAGGLVVNFGPRADGSLSSEYFGTSWLYK